MKTVLILGPADTSYGINTIIKYDNVKIVEGLYGKSSDLARAFKYFSESDDTTIYLANILYKSDYLDVINTARFSELDYIVPLGIKFSDVATDSITGIKIGRASCREWGLRLV